MSQTLDDVVLTNARLSSPAITGRVIGDGQFRTEDPLAAIRQQHQYLRSFAQAHGVAGAAERRAVHVARGAGTLETVRAGLSVVAAGDSTHSVDVLKNGVSVLSGPASLTSAQAAYAKVTGVVTSAAYAIGDVFEVVVAVAAGTGTLGQGLFVDLAFREAAD